MRVRRQGLRYAGQRHGPPASPLQEADSSGYSGAGTLMWARAFNSSSPIRRAVADGAACCVNTYCACTQQILLLFSCKLRNVKNTLISLAESPRA